MRAELDPERATLTISREGADPTLLESADPWLSATRGSATVKERFGQFGFSDDRAPWQLASELEPDGAEGFTLRFADGKGELSLRSTAPGVIALELRGPPDQNRTRIAFRCAASDQFVGLGAQTRATHRGRYVPLWVQEQGIGKSDGETHNGAYSFLGDTYDSYFPVPVLANPNRYMVLVDTTRRVELDLCHDDRERWTVTVWGSSLELKIVGGSDAKQMIERMTAITGRPKLPTPWVFAPWLDAIKGSANVRNTAEIARSRKIPASAIWTEDWAGGHGGVGGYHLDYSWHVDRKLYPDIEKLAGELHRQGFRFLGYLNTFIIDGSPEWKETQAKQLLVEGSDGKPLTFLGPPRLQKTALLDLTKPAARRWAMALMKEQVELGLDGWMADYGEWLPYESVLADGRSGAVAHNDYPRQWQKLNRDFFRSARPKGDYTYFVRSGWTGSQTLAPVVWAGDQNTDFGADDGLPTIVPIGLNLAISGVPFYGHDIAGYTSLFAKPSDRELFYRWTQLGAFSPVMRTHHGTSGGEGWNFAKDERTLAMFARHAREHVRLFPYLYGLAKQATRTGMPLMRPMWIHHPQMGPEIADQYLLGRDLLVAPVVTRGARRRTVKLPAGAWYDYWNGDALRGPKTISAAAPLDRIPVYARGGAVIPQLPDTVQTLAPTAGKIVDLEAVAGQLVVRAFHAGQSDAPSTSRFTLADGGELTFTSGRAPGADLELRSAGTKLASCDSSSPPCADHDRAKRTVTVKLPAATKPSLEGRSGGQSSFSFSGTFSRPTSVELRLIY